MFVLRRFHQDRFDRVNAVIDGLNGHLTSYINLIGSATLPLPEVCQAQGLPGSALRAEGFPGARVFPGSEVADAVEEIIDERTRMLFGLGRSYLVTGQPHSATQANQAVFRAVVPQDAGVVLGLAPADGGHISHRAGLPRSTEFVPFPLCATGIDYDELEAIARTRAANLVVAGGTSYGLQIDYARLRQIADQCGAHLHADLAHTAPFVASGRHPSAFPECDSATLDTGKNLRGPRGGILIYRQDQAKTMRRALFPTVQTSPSQSAMMAKAVCLLHWNVDGLGVFSDRMVTTARLLNEGFDRAFGDPVFGGTDSHLLLYDMAALGVRGNEAERHLEGARILANRNQVPADPNSPWSPSGLRFGTTVLAILGYSDVDVERLASAVRSVLTVGDDPRETVDDLLQRYHRDVVSIANESTS